MDSDIFWDKYEAEIKDWDIDQIVHELRLLKSDFDDGMINQTGYDRTKKLLESEMEQKIYGANHPLSPEKAYDRAMKGI